MTLRIGGVGSTATSSVGGVNADISFVLPNGVNSIAFLSEVFLGKMISVSWFGTRILLDQISFTTNVF